MTVRRVAVSLRALSGCGGMCGRAKVWTARRDITGGWRGDKWAGVRGERGCRRGPVGVCSVEIGSAIEIEGEIGMGFVGIWLQK